MKPGKSRTKAGRDEKKEKKTDLEMISCVLLHVDDSQAGLSSTNHGT